MFKKFSISFQNKMKIPENRNYMEVLFLLIIRKFKLQYFKTNDFVMKKNIHFLLENLAIKYRPLLNYANT